MPKFIRESRYLVLNFKHTHKYLTEEELYILTILAQKVNEGRRWDHKPVIKCVVVESDWPEYEPTWKAIENRMNKNSNTTKRA